MEIAGLTGLEYQNHLKDMAIEKEGNEYVLIKAETDRTYLSVPREIHLATGHGRVTLRTSATLPDAVVWNPWIEKSKVRTCGLWELAL